MKERERPETTTPLFDLSHSHLPRTPSQTLFRYSPTISRLTHLTSRGEIDLVWHGGDVGYADDSFVHKDCVFAFCYESVYDE